MNFIDVAPEQIETISRHRYTAGVSICIPAYNEEATIEEAIRSAAATLQRSGLAGEILVLDDRSADRTWEILQRLKDIVPKVQIRRHQVNQGIARPLRNFITGRAWISCFSIQQTANGKCKFCSTCFP